MLVLALQFSRNTARREARRSLQPAQTLETVTRTAGETPGVEGFESLKTEEKTRSAVRSSEGGTNPRLRDP
jgi:hypothetical protein